MNILFVCTGNTCRSCMAEAIFNHMCNVSDIKASSAGVSVLKNSKTSQHTASVLIENLNIDIRDREAIQLTLDMVEKSDLVLTMTSNIRDFLVSQMSNSKDNIYSLNQFISIDGDIVDPFGSDINIYRETYKQLKNSILLLLDKIKEEENIK